jgi:serine protease
MRRLLLPLVTIGLGALVFKLAASPAAQDEGTVGDAVSAAGPGVLVLDLQDNATEADIAALEARLGGVDLEWSSAVSEDEGLVRATVDDLGALVSLAGRDPLVELAEAEVTLTALEHPNDPLWEKQWNLRQIGVHRGWRVGAGAGVTVAVIDTGVSVVEDLEGATILTGRSFVPGVSSAQDDHGHGTHVAGTIAQVTNNGVGVAGVAPGVRILPLKTLSAQGSGSSDHIAAAIDEAVDQGADVINLSLGGGYSEIIHKAVIAARDEGVLVFAAAGNDGRRSVSFPGALPEAIGVGAVGPDDLRSFYSNFGPGVDLTAPGGNTKLGEEAGVLQDTLDGKGGHAYRFLQGTSMATPHAAGAAAVLLGMGLSPEETTATILGTSVDLGAKGFDEEYGHGRLSLDAAVTRALTRTNALSFAVAGLMALVLARGARSPWASALGVGLVAAAVSGGLFFLPMLPAPPSLAVTLLSRELLLWPSVLDLSYARNPLWASAVLPALLAFTFGPTRAFGGLAAGICVGFGASLLQLAASGASLSLLGGVLSGAWLWTNGVICLLTAMAVLGLQRALRASR